MKLSALFALFFALMIGTLPAHAAYAPARAAASHSTALPDYKVAAHEKGAGISRGAWKQKLAARVVRSKAGRWTLKTVSRMAMPAEGSTNTLSLVAGILGIVSLVTLFFVPLFPLLASIAALVLGIVGLGQANKRNEGGMGWALTGIICGGLTLLIYLIAIIFVAAFLF